MSLNSSHKNGYRNHTNRIFYKNIFRVLNECLHPTGRMQLNVLHLWGFLYVRDAGHRGNKIIFLTKFIIFFLPIRYYAKLKKMEEEREQELASKYRDRVSKCQWWRQGLHSPWKSLKIAVGAGKSLNFGANFIQPRFSRT